MTSVMVHRGPDGSGVIAESNLGMAHARLSIIDIDGGHQPMSTADNSLWITFNGEIFNYVELREDLIKRGHHFQTRSDTEVILRLYLERGEACVHELNGQWAFAIWDKSSRKLFLSRDRMGVRPLYFTQNDGDFIFASEIKAILQNPGIPRRLDVKALDQIFTFWVTIPPRTAFEGISQLPPGHSMVVMHGTVTTKKYWEAQYVTREEYTPPQDERAADHLLALLEDATRIRLRSDVPVGAYLSGGIDSTLITALARRFAHDRLRTFSVGFDTPEYDESAYQDEASKFLSTEHSQVYCAKHDIAGAFPDIIWHTEQPVMRTAPAPLFVLSGLVRQSGFKVVLTGEGSDEMFGGYDIFKEAKIRRFWAKQPNSRLRPTLLRRLYPYLQNVQRQPKAYLQNFFRVKNGDLSSPFFSHLPRWELTSKLKLFFSKEIRSRLNDYDGLAELESRLPDAYACWPSFCQSQFLETALLLPGYLLSSQGDRVAMAHSIEGRYPFLDHRVVDFASQLHPSLKMRVLNEKYLLKRAAKGLIPESILRRPKQPYRAPDGQCFFGAAAHPYVEQLLSSEKVREFDIFDSNSVQKLVAKFNAGQAVTATKDDMALVGILSTQLMMQRFGCGS